MTETTRTLENDGADDYDEMDLLDAVDVWHLEQSREAESNPIPYWLTLAAGALGTLAWIAYLAGAFDG